MSKDTINIEFINPDQNFFYNDNAKQYFGTIFPLETYYKSNKQTFRKELLPILYQNNTYKWSNDEMLKIKEYIENAIEILQDQECYILSNLSWKLVKLSHKIEWGYPFTIGDTIILPNDDINFVTNSEEIQQEFINTLIHEQIHVFQKANLEIFDNFYVNNWNWIPNQRINIRSADKERIVHNPDGMDIRWIWKCPDTDEYVFQSLYLQPTVKKENSFKDKIIERRWILLEAETYGKRTLYDLQSVVEDIPCFQKYLPGKNHMYHPHEMFAYLASGYLSNNLEVDSNSDYIKKMVNFITNNF
jgi:hypothetical protein